MVKIVYVNMGVVKVKKIKMDLLKGVNGFVIDLDDNNLTYKRHNGIMKLIESFNVNVDDLKKIITNYEKAETPTKK